MASPRLWRKTPQHYRLDAVRCNDCGRVSYPPTRVCSGCRGDELHPTQLALTGRLVHCAVDAIGGGVGLIETDDGARLVCQMTDCKSAALRPGQRVRLVFRRLGYDPETQTVHYGHKATPILDAPADDERN